MNEQVSRRNFIRLGAALSVTATGASMLSACGGGSSGSSGKSGGSGNASKSSAASSATSGSASSSSSGSASSEPTTTASKGGGAKQAPKGNPLASVSSVAPGSAVNFKDSGQPAVLVHLNSGDFVAYSRICTHQGCTVAYQNGQLACPCHGSIYDPAHRARVVAGPAPRPLPEIQVKVQGGKVYKA